MRSESTNCGSGENAKGNNLEASFGRLWRYTYVLPSGRMVKIMASDESELVAIQLKSRA